MIWKYFVFRNFKNISSSLTAKTGKRKKTKPDSSVESVHDSSVEVLKVQRKPRARSKKKDSLLDSYESKDSVEASTSKKRQQVKRKRGGGLHNKDLVCLTSSSGSDDNLPIMPTRDLNKVTDPQKSYEEEEEIQVVFIKNILVNIKKLLVIPTD